MQIKKHGSRSVGHIGIKVAREFIDKETVHRSDAQPPFTHKFLRLFHVVYYPLYFRGGKVRVDFKPRLFFNNVYPFVR